MSSETTLRLAVGAVDGRRSSTWRIWFGPLDIYAGFRSISGVRKVSVHYPRPGKTGTLRYIGFTKEFAEKDVGVPVRREDRTHTEWRGLEIAPNYFIEFRFRIPESELRHLASDQAKDVLWLQPPQPGFASEVTILSGPATHVGLAPKRDDGGRVDQLLQHQLQNGRVVWVLHHHIPAPTPEVLRSFRDLVSTQAGGRPPADSTESTANHRICLTMDCGDGSAAEVELAADFLYLTPLFPILR